MNGRMRLLPAVVALALAASSAGCAFGTRHAHLVYPPPANSAESGAAVAEAAPAPGGFPIILLRFNDLRSDKSVVGTVRNGFGMRTAKVVADNDVAGWVTDAVGQELEQAGYRVTVVHVAENDSGPPVLSGDVLKVFGDAYLVYTGEVTFRAKVTRDGHEIHAAEYTSKKSGGLNATASADSYANALAAALADDIAQLLADLSRLPDAAGDPGE